jgi:ribosomal protein S18 acetylase RimI-like enzyme
VVVDPKHNVRKARLRDVDEVSDVPAAAFHDDTWTRWTVDDDDHQTRIRSLQRLAMVELALPYGQIWTSIDGDGRIASAAFCMNPGPPVPPEILAHVATRSACLEGTRHSRSAAAQSVLEPLRPTAPHFFLGAVGTRPDHQRHGHGHTVLQPVLELADRQRTDLYLETSAAPNVAFYEALGFRISGEVEAPGGGPHVWAMVRTRP